MIDNAFGVWEGEVTVELPETFDAGLYYIGRVRTPWTRREQCPKNSRVSDAVCRSMRASPRRSPRSRPAPTSWCSIGWIARPATSSCRTRGITASYVAPLRCARRRDRTRLRPAWCGFSSATGRSSRS